MSIQERADIVNVLNSLPNDQLQFILGYAAGLNASVTPVKEKDGKQAQENKAS